MQEIEQILLLPAILTIMIHIIQRYETNSFSVFELIELDGSVTHLMRAIALAQLATGN